MIKSLGASNYNVANKIVKNSESKNTNSSEIKNERQDRLTQISKQIASGSYKIDIDKIANAILKDIV